ncbi:PRTRC system protein B [Pseudomonas brenneri]|jgi:PRTRC genetic system protein B|uniref:PRTRC system protein B n=1 Tax=Pseudomonas brenneri TaxID=129817 RepID=UPI003BA279D2
MLNSEIKAQALLAFHHTKSGRLDFTTHQVIATAEMGQYTLGAGRAFTEEDKESLIDLLLNVEGGIEFIDPCILVKSRRMLVWYHQPQVINVLFKEEAHTAPIPGLIFIATPGKLRCYAFKGKARPTPHTKLFYAPLGNMYTNGSFCTGNCDTPKDNALASIPGWERFVLECTNTHTGGTQVLRSASTYQEMVGFYKRLADAAAKDFPTKELIPVPGEPNHLTLQDALSDGGAA